MDKRTSKPKTSKSSIPTSSTKSSSKSKLPKKGEEPKKSSKKTKTPTPEPPVEDEYASDFEEYESDFEEDVSEIKPPAHKNPSKPAATSSVQPKSLHFEEEVSQNDDDEETRKESFLLNRFNQAKHSNASSSSSIVPTSIMRNTNEPRPTTSVNRVFRFESRAAPNTEELMQSAKVFAQLKSEGNLTKEFIQSVDIPPNRVSELFNSLVENSTSSQRFTQTGDDNLGNTQTTPRDNVDKANQFPSIFAKTENSQNSKVPRKFDNFSTAERFLKFVGITGRTILSLMSANNEVESVHLPLRSNVEFSAGFVQFTLDQIAKTYKPIGVEISQDGEPKILVGFYVQDSNQHPLLDKSILLEYSFSDMEEPTNVYLTGDEITDFTYSSDGKTLIFAGQRSGNCLLWDLLNRRQANENTPQIELHTKTAPQLPAYSTAHVYVEHKKRAFMHQPDQSVIRTKALRSNDSNGQQQFLSLHAGASATIWAVTRDQFLSTNADDLGLDFMSLVRLMKISTNVCSTIVGFGSGAQVALCLDVSSSRSAEFIVGMSNGVAIRICRSRQTEAQIRRYYLSNGISFNHSSANAICFCPQDPNYFAVGTSIGNLLIFKTDQPDPLMEVQLKENRSYRVGQLTDMVWSHSHNQILYALYDSKFFAVWDLSSQLEPEIMDLSFCLSQKFTSTVTRMFAWNAVNNTYYIAFTLASGSVLIHELHRVSAQNIEAGKLFAG